MNLTEKRIARLRTTPGRYRDERNLVLQVLSPTNASWLFCYERNGRAHAMGLGPLHTINLSEARARARVARQLLLDGIDPLEAKRAARTARALEAARQVTFKQVAELYFDAHAATWNNFRHRQQFNSTLRDFVYPFIGNMPVAAVDEPVIIRMLTPIWKTKTVTAKRVRNRVAAVLDYAAAAKFRAGTNPARWEGHLEHLLPAPEKFARVAHHSALPYAELGGFMVELRKQKSVVARALEFAILTAARTGEVVGATWEEIDFDARTWTIPGERMKAGKEHRVPLSDAAIKLLSALYREQDNNFVFIGTRPGSRIINIAMYRLLQQLRSDVTIHGFRSTFSTWAHETTSYPGLVIEQSLAHTVGSAVERAYRRGDLFDKRRKLMDAWAKCCSNPARASGEVVPLRGQK